jgi:chorismate synthase
MSNTFGKKFRLTSSGESHGPAYVGIIDGCPPNMVLSEADIQPFLDARKPGADKTTSQRREDDKLEILSGIFEGKTTGAPIAFMIRNQDARSKDYDAYKDVFRPGHADYTYQQKYGIRDHRGGGRASARETCLRVVAGAIAEKYLKEKGISFEACLTQIGKHKIDPNDTAKIAELIDDARKNKDSLGAKVKVRALNVPAGIGEPIFNKLDAAIAHAMMGIPAVKAVEIGSGIASCEMLGSEHRDAMQPDGFASNHAGGILGGISTGQPIEVLVTFKPTSSIPQAIDTINLKNQSTSVTVTGRHDPCVGIRGVPVARATLAMLLMDYII